MDDTTQSTWLNATVADLVEKYFCGPSPDCEERQLYGDTEWGVLKTTAVSWSGWDATAHKVLPRSFWGQHDIEVQAGDILVTKAGPRNRVGVISHVTATPPHLVVSGKMIGLRPRRDSVLPEVLAGLLALKGPQKYIQERTTGMAESQVNFANEVLLNTPVSVPPKTEQIAIARVANTLDAAIRQTEAIIEKLKQVKQGLLHDLLTRGIDANGELRPPRFEAPHLYKHSPIGWIPKEWDLAQLGKVAALQRGYDIVEANLVPGPYPVISSSGIVGYHRVSTSRGPNVVVGRKGSIGTVHYVETDFWAHDTSLFVTNFFGNDERFVFHLFSYLKLGQYGTKSGSPSLNRNDVHPLWIGRPSLDEQKVIVHAITSHGNGMSRSVQELDKFKKLKFALMDDLLTGRVRATPLLP